MGHSLQSCRVSVPQSLNIHNWPGTEILLILVAEEVSLVIAIEKHSSDKGIEELSSL